MNILVIIPARGGSKGIPRKNLRALNGKPLIYYSIAAALNSKYNPDVYVSSDDEEILMVAKKFGAKTHLRGPVLANDKATLDPVIWDAWKTISSKNGKTYDYIVTVQPTSPLLQSLALDNALEKINSNPKIETVISAREEAHLSWRRDGEKFVPNYKERVNRQYLEPVFYETGAFVICRSKVLENKKTRIGEQVDLFVVNRNESIDIDNYEDWSVCEYLLKRKKVLFVTSGYNEIGLGHIYRSLLLANNILNHHIYFLVDHKSQIGLEKIKESHYEAYIQDGENLLEDVKQLKPDVVINDILDTDKNYVRELKKTGMKVINFEDLGDGAREADMVINALYPENEVLENHYFGVKYFCPRDEFLISEYKKVKKEVNHVLITMGGIDPGNLTLKILKSIYAYCREKEIAINVVLGLGYKEKDSLSEFKEVNIVQNIRTMSEFMLSSDIVFTSAGRTVYEVACLGTPTIVLAQNQRELTHFFASPKNGFINLGLGQNLSEKNILEAFLELAGSFNKRLAANRAMLQTDVRKGRDRVINLIQKAIGE